MSSNDKLVVLLTIFAITYLTSVSSNTTAVKDISAFGERIPQTTSPAILTTAADNATTDLATDSTNWIQEVRTSATLKPDVVESEAKTTIADQKYFVSLLQVFFETLG